MVLQVVYCSFFCQHKFLVLLVAFMHTGDSVGHNADDAHYPKREELQGMDIPSVIADALA